MTTASITSVTFSQNVDSGYNIYLVDASNNDVTLTLPDITSDGFYFTFKRVDTVFTNTVTIVGNNNQQTIDNVSSLSLTDNTSLSVVSHGSVWWRL
jgi:hypothetical protein